MWIGYDDPDRLITYPDAHNLSRCAQPIQIATTYPHTQPDPAKVAYFGRFRSISLQFAPQIAPLPPPIGGIAPLEPRHAGDTLTVDS